MKKPLFTLLLPALLAGCSELDMQGVDPNDYYAQHPIENKVETRSASFNAHFIPGRDRLTADDAGSLRSAMGTISPLAVDTVQVQMHKADIGNAARKEHLSKLLRSMGYSRQAILFEPSESVRRNEARLDVSYAAVVSPRCPDWRTSPVTTYSNTSQGGFGCATATNLGLMVADPRDLERGSGRTRPDAERNSNVLQNYRGNRGAGEDAALSAEVNTSTSSQ